MPRFIHRWMLTRRFCTMLVMLALTHPADAAATNDTPEVVSSLRVFSTQPRVFEYLFTGAMSGPATNTEPLLCFRDLAGNAPTVRINEPLGSYSVIGFTPRTTRVFNKSVSAYLDNDVSLVTLRDAAGSNRVLTVGRPLIEPGLMACLVSTASGGWGYVRSGDALNIEGVDVTVIRVATNDVTIRAQALDISIPPIDDTARKSILALWESRRRDAEARQARELALATEAKRLQASKDNAAAALQPIFTAEAAAAEQATFYGDYYPFMTGGLPPCFGRHHGGEGHWRH